MKLVKFIDSDGNPTWINPEHVISVSLFRDLDVNITTVAGGVVTVVAEDEEEVVQKLTGP